MGRPKLLLPLGDTTVVGATIRSLRAGGVERIVLVAAAGDAALRAWAEGVGGVLLAENPAPERGMLSTILCGVQALGGVAAVAATGGPLLVTPADMPAILPETVRRLIAAASEAATPLAVPVYRGKRGHPLAVAASAVREMAGLDPTVGLRQILDRLAVRELAVDDPGVVADLDTPGDYERLRGEPDASARPRESRER